MPTESPIQVGRVPPNFERGGLIQHHVAFISRLARLFDGVILFLCLYFVVKISGEQWNDDFQIISILAILIFEALGSIFDLYRSWRVVRFRYEFLNITLDWSLTVLSVVFILSVFEFTSVELDSVIFLWLVSSLGSIVVSHFAIRILERYSRTFGYDSRKVAFIGANERAIALINTFKSHPWMGMRVHGIFEDRTKVRGIKELVNKEEHLAGCIADLILLAEEGNIDAVFITLPMVAEARIVEIVNSFSDTTVSIYYCPSFMGFDLKNARWDNIGNQPVISVLETPFYGIAAFIKRTEDLLFSVIIIPIVIIPAIIAAIAILISSPGPILFRQSRYGFNGKKFMIWKFRTMYHENSKLEFFQAKKNDSRVTKVGSFLRKTSIDELPQLINVLRGDMSIVGPRPHPDKLNEGLRKDIHQYMIRHKIKPGITGLAQVNGYRGETRDIKKMEKRINYDLQYMREWSLWLDLKILIKTLPAVFAGDAY